MGAADHQLQHEQKKQSEVCAQYMQTSNLHDSTLHEIGDLGREINEFFSKKTDEGEARPHSTLTQENNLVFDFPPKADNE